MKIAMVRLCLDRAAWWLATRSRPLRAAFVYGYRWQMRRAGVQREGKRVRVIDL